MTVLALDTTTDHGSLALIRDGVLVWEREMHSTEGFSHILFKDLHELLEVGGVRLADVDLFAAASGPGSFTGVRVGLTTVKALAEATGRSAIGVSNLQALASFGTAPLRAVLIDARRHECYAAVYDADLQLRSEEIVGDPKKWLAALPDNSYQFVSQNGSWLESLGIPAPQILTAPLFVAPGIAHCAELLVARGVPTDPVILDANYVRRSDVNLYWHDR